MNISKNKINVALGAVTGVLVGFVLGVSFGTPAGRLEGDGSRAKGDVAHISQIRKSLISPTDKPVAINKEESVDTLSVFATDMDGKEMQIMIVKEK